MIRSFGPNKIRVLHSSVETVLGCPPPDCGCTEIVVAHNLSKVIRSVPHARVPAQFCIVSRVKINERHPQKFGVLLLQGKDMRYTWEDNIKTRLTDRAQLMVAVERLIERGIPEELIPVRLAHAFYVDIDELNAVLDMMRVARPAREDAVGHPFQAVA